MKRSCWAVTRDELRENSCKLDTSRHVRPCPRGAMGRGGPSPQEAPSPARGLPPLRPPSRAQHGCALLPQLEKPSSLGEKRCSAARQANKLIACKCMFVLEFPPAATAAWQHTAMLRHGKGWLGKGTKTDVVRSSAWSSPRTWCPACIDFLRTNTNLHTSLHLSLQAGDMIFLAIACLMFDACLEECRPGQAGPAQPSSRTWPGLFSAL